MDLPNKSDTPGPNQANKRVKEQVVSGAVPVQRSGIRRFADHFLAESPKDIGKRIGSEVVAFRLKQGLEEAVVRFIGYMLWGENAPVGRNVPMLNRGGVNYAGISSGPNSRTHLETRGLANAKPVAYEDLVFNTMNEAELVLANLVDILNQYRVVAIGDLNDLVGNTSQPSDNAYGWNNLDGVRISQDRQGFRLELPRPTLI